ncbi:uncharacterized protein BJX67DRAFT_377365 [Aspergillus lucknowensis]|uniref:BTB domain-containing protein n=1 Tax=Aspergillus lucknowensis TaxID=176173 RepID=A0ABR4M4U9_9EURO
MADRPLSSRDTPGIEYHQPLASPYILPMVTVKIGEKSYGVPSQYLRNFPQLDRDWSSDPCLVLSDIHEDAGHTVVNFLYTGNYETTRSTFDREISPIAREFRMSVFVYQASRTYDLRELEVLAKKVSRTFR